jgi:hypothetical protein
MLGDSEHLHNIKCCFYDRKCSLFVALNHPTQQGWPNHRPRGHEKARRKNGGLERVG